MASTSASAGTSMKASSIGPDQRRGHSTRPETSSSKPGSSRTVSPSASGRRSIAPMIARRSARDRDTKPRAASPDSRRMRDGIAPARGNDGRGWCPEARFAQRQRAIKSRAVEDGQHVMQTGGPSERHPAPQRIDFCQGISPCTLDDDPASTSVVAARVFSTPQTEGALAAFPLLD